MAELGSGVKKLLITNGDKKPAYQPQFITEVELAEHSAKEIYFCWLSRLVTLCAVVSLAFFLCGSLVIFRLAPEVIVEPLLITNQSDSENMVRYEPMAVDMSSHRKLMEMFIKQYVIMRNTVVNDEQEMRTRWGPGGIVNYLSVPEVYQDFVGQNIEHVEKMFDKNFSSEVRIDKIGKISEDSPAWEVDFTVYNLSNGHSGKNGSLTLKIVKYRASITPKFMVNRRAIFPRLINPLGFTVLKYNQDEIRN